MQETFVRNVTTATFDEQVLERSRQVPVVVDFWAAWCRPCLMLGPVLEKLAAAANGSWELVKVDIDHEPELAQRYKVQSIPAVKGFYDGHVADEFVGALPEREVRAFLTRLVPSHADALAVLGRQRRTAGDLKGAEAAFAEALKERPDHAKARLGMAELLAERGDADQALALLEAIPPHAEESRQAAALLARLQFVRDSADVLSHEEALKLLSANGSDLDALWALATHAAAGGDYAAALQYFLAVTETSRQYRDDGGRRAMLAIFTILGADHALSMEYRPRLAAALH